jgi:hypothetical protein
MLRECFKNEQLATVVLEEDAWVKTILTAAQASAPRPPSLETIRSESQALAIHRLGSAAVGHNCVTAFARA